MSMDLGLKTDVLSMQIYLGTSQIKIYVPLVMHLDSDALNRNIYDKQRKNDWSQLFLRDPD